MYRGFNSPLNYYLANSDRYYSMRRGELSLFDEALYRALLRHDQLDIVIPKVDKLKSIGGRRGGKTKPLTPYDIEFIVSTYDRYDTNPNEASNHIPYSAGRIRRVWRKFGLKTIGKGGYKKSIYSKN